ncbi:MAG: DUF4347 domain-containing protein [Ginsengibacter sp.]
MVFDKNDNALAPLAGKTAEVVGITSVTDAVAKATTAQRRTLIIVGHGEPGTIGMGAGESAGYTQGKDLKFDKLIDVRSQLQTLSERYAPAPVENPTENSNLLVLCGCKSGDGENGAALVRNLSNIFRNTYVVASNVSTSVGSWQRSMICAWQVSSGNPTRWTTRASTIGFNGGIVNGRETMTAVINLVNNRACVQCDTPAQCKTAALSLKVRVQGCGG